MEPESYSMINHLDRQDRFPSVCHCLHQSRSHISTHLTKEAGQEAFVVPTTTQDSIGVSTISIQDRGRSKPFSTTEVVV